MKRELETKKGKSRQRIEQLIAQGSSRLRAFRLAEGPWFEPVCSHKESRIWRGFFTPYVSERIFFTDLNKNPVGEPTGFVMSKQPIDTFLNVNRTTK